MANRVIRDEILNSERWLNLPTDTHRLVFLGLILIADDYGNVEGGPRRLFRWMHSFSQVKTEADAIKLMSDLHDAGMVLRYTGPVDKEYWHITRFKNLRRYWSRKYPVSPYETKQIQELAENPSADLPQPSRSPSARRGVGVGEGEKLLRKPCQAKRCIRPAIPGTDLCALHSMKTTVS